MKNNTPSYTRTYGTFRLPECRKKIPGIYTQPNPTNPLPHAIIYSVFFPGVFDAAGGCRYNMFTLSPAEVPSATLQPQALYLDLRRVLAQSKGIIQSYPCNIQLA